MRYTGLAPKVKGKVIKKRSNAVSQWLKYKLVATNKPHFISRSVKMVEL